MLFFPECVAKGSRLWLGVWGLDCVCRRWLLRSPPFVCVRSIALLPCRWAALTKCGKMICWSGISSPFCDMQCDDVCVLRGRRSICDVAQWLFWCIAVSGLRKHDQDSTHDERHVVVCPGITSKICSPAQWEQGQEAREPPLLAPEAPESPRRSCCCFCCPWWWAVMAVCSQAGTRWLILIASLSQKELGVELVPALFLQQNWSAHPAHQRR